MQALMTQAAETSHNAVARALDPHGRERGLPLRTLVMLRWLGIGGQTAAVLGAAFGLGFEVALAPALGAIGASAGFNMIATARLAGAAVRREPERETAAQLGFDVVQLAVLLSLTGGLENPFCLLLVAPVTVAAAALPARYAILIGVLALIATAMLFFWYLPLPWLPGAQLQLPGLYRGGMWAAVVVGILFSGGYAWRVADEAERAEAALVATQAVLAREQRLAALGGLAAAAAHELGTPLATIQVVAKEMLRAAPASGPIAEDAQLLLQQAERCRDILRRLSERPDDGDAMHARLGLLQLLEEAAEPHRGLDIAIECSLQGPPDEPPPEVSRQPEALHGLSALVENAADFAVERVRVVASYDSRRVRIDVIDDGPGFAPEVLPRLGEPYVTTRPKGEGSPSGHEGMGLGFFIARTLLERTGAHLAFGPGTGPDGKDKGAKVSVIWPREALEAPPA